MSRWIGVGQGVAVAVEGGPGRVGYVAPDVPVDGEVVTLPDGRVVKQVALGGFESLFTVSTVLRGQELTEVDPLAGYFGDELMLQSREVERDERVAVWFPWLPGESAERAVPGAGSDEVLAVLAEVVAAAMPEGWAEVVLDCEAVGLRMAVASSVEMADGGMRYWSPPAVVGQWLHRLRLRDYHPGRFLWHRIRVEFRPGAVPVRTFGRPDPPSELTLEEAADDLRLFPRKLTLVQDWLLGAATRSEQAWRAGHAARPEPGGDLDLVRLFDGQDDSGRPLWYRAVLGDRDREAVLSYLEGAPLVLSSRGRTRDELGAEDSAVPMGFHTDGRFVWPSAVAYYLRVHGVPPVSPLVEWIRAVRHQLPESVPAIAMDRAVSLATGRPWDESEVDAKAHRAMAPVEAAIVDKRISPRRYSVFAEREGAWCLVRDGDRYRVQWSLEQRTAVLFDDVRQAAAHLAGQLAANAADLGLEPGEEIPAWQSPLIVLSDDPPVESFASITSAVVEDVEVDRYGGPDGNLVFVAGTPFAERGLPAEFEQRPYRRYRLARGQWQVLAVVSEAGGRGYLLPQAIGDYLRSGHIEELAVSEHPGLPPVTDEMRAEAARNPGGWLYCADPDADPRFIEGMPLPVLLGGYKVGADGRLTGETYLNEEYRPSPRRRGYPEPRTDFELVLGYVGAGWLPKDRLLPVFLDSPFILETDGRGGLRIGVDAEGRRFLVAYSSPQYAPPEAQAPQQVEGRDLAPALAGVTLVVNPGGVFGVDLPGDGLLRAASPPIG